jgi:tetratricopeptide (TPR) repeat protein
MRQPLPRTIALAGELTRLAQEDQNPAQIAVAARSLGYSLLMVGEFSKAAKILAHGAATADSIGDREFAVYGEHPSIICRFYGGQAKLSLGFPDSAVQLLEDALATARRKYNAHSVAWALSVAAHVLTIQHEAATAVRLASQALETAREHYMPQWIAIGERCLGWAMHRLGNFTTGLDLLTQGVKRWYETGAKLHTTHCELALVDCFLREDRIAEARVHLDDARAHMTNYGETYLAVEMDRLEALVLQGEQAPTEQVEEYLLRSLDTSRRQSARLFELHTATAFAEFLAARGERQKAIDTLMPVYRWFTEGLDTTDLREAKRVLETLM